MTPTIIALLLLLFLVTFSTSSSSPSVIIMGAGPAGIAAATRLLEHKFKNIVVLEAENRIGGRINSVLFGEAFIDLGAEWCHGEKDNIVHDLVKDLHILGHTESPTTIYHSSRKPIDQEFADELIDIMDSIYMPDGSRHVDEGKILGDYCIEKFNQTIHEKYERNNEKLQVAKLSLDLFHHSVLGSEGAFSWFEPSAESDYRDCAGDLNLNWNGLGYKTVLEVLMKKFPDPSKQLPFDETVFLNKEVTKVLWNESSIRSAITVLCSDKSSFTADHVIFTPSIGVLKDHHEAMFFPHLPRAKQEAIKQIGFGAVMKIAMHFKDRWWPDKNFTGFNFVWSNVDKTHVLKEFSEGPIKDGRSWLTEIFSVIPVENNPNVLVAWITGGMIPEIELVSNETMIHGLGFVLNKFVGHHFNTSEPNVIIRSSWYTNPHFRGTYSYQTVEARKGGVSAEIELSKPLLNIEGRPIVQFAGEATHPHFYSTVHGAIETGYREADRIIHLYKR